MVHKTLKLELFSYLHRNIHRLRVLLPVSCHLAQFHFRKPSVNNCARQCISNQTNEEEVDNVCRFINAGFCSSLASSGGVSRVTDVVLKNVTKISRY